MPKSARILTAVAALLLVAVFVLPLWTIRLIAPQYPEGLGMLIRVNTVTGIQPTDLDNINQLNHYIGMKRIEADTIPPLQIMPWVVAALIVTGLGVAAAGRRALLTAWVGGFVAAATTGLVVFWQWEHDFGHNIDFEHAIIKVPDMTYQPPLIGSKQLLNFIATSWPAPGAWIAGAAFVLAFAALLITWRSSSPAPVPHAALRPVEA